MLRTSNRACFYDVRLFIAKWKRLQPLNRICESIRKCWLVFPPCNVSSHSKCWLCSLTKQPTACYTFFELCHNIAFIENGCKYMYHPYNTHVMLMFMFLSLSLSLSLWMYAGLTSLLTSHPNTCTACLLACLPARSFALVPMYAWWWIRAIRDPVCLHYQQVQKPARLFRQNLLFFSWIFPRHVIAKSAQTQSQFPMEGTSNPICSILSPSLSLTHSVYRTGEHISTRFVLRSCFGTMPSSDPLWRWRGKFATFESLRWNLFSS